MPVAYGTDRVDATHVAQAQIHERDVRVVLLEERDRLFAGLGFGDESHVGLAPDHGGEPFPQDRMIIDGEDADRLWGACGHLAVPSFVDHSRGSRGAAPPFRAIQIPRVFANVARHAPYRTGTRP